MSVLRIDPKLRGSAVRGDDFESDSEQDGQRRRVFRRLFVPVVGYLLLGGFLNFHVVKLI